VLALLLVNAATSRLEVFVYVDLTSGSVAIKWLKLGWVTVYGQLNYPGI